MKISSYLLIGFLITASQAFANSNSNWSCNVQQIKLTSSQEMKNVISSSSDMDATIIPTQSDDLTESLAKVDRALTANCQIGNAVKLYKSTYKSDTPQNLGWFYQPRQKDPMKITLIPNKGDVKVTIPESKNQSLAMMLDYLYAGHASLKAYLDVHTVRDDLMLCFYSCEQNDAQAQTNK